MSIRIKQVICILLGLSFIGLLAFIFIKDVRAIENKKFQGKLYEKLVESAQRGNLDAEKELEKLNVFLEKNDIKHEEIKEELIQKAIKINDTNVSIVGLKPYYLKIYNTDAGKLLTQKSLDEYIAKRRKALEKIISQNPEETIEVNVSVSKELNLEQFYKISNKYGLTIEQITLDKLVDEKWQGTIIVGNDWRNLFDFSSAETIQKQLEERANKALSLLGQSGTLTFNLLDAKGKIVVKNAIALQNDPMILLIDPIDDLKKPFINQAADVKVMGMPSIFAIKRSLSGQSPGPSKILTGSPVPFKKKFYRGEPIPEPIPESKPLPSFLPLKRGER